MELTTSTTHLITFSVQAFWDEEGGMGNDMYGDPVQELADAIRLLELARVGEKKKNKWVIVCDVETTVK